MEGSLAGRYRSSRDLGTIGALPRLLEAAAAVLLAGCHCSHCHLSTGPWGLPGEAELAPLSACGWRGRGQLCEYNPLQSKILQCNSCSKRLGNRCTEQQREALGLQGGCLECDSTCREMRSPETTSPSVQYYSSCITCSLAEWGGGQRSSFLTQTRAGVIPRQLLSSKGRGKVQAS